ncbi:MAG TPA: ABC transporter permease [Acidimicrobiales bacterium]|nr:ABC transporter permease [Acidimicrobiales bacterium]
MSAAAMVVDTHGGGTFTVALWLARRSLLMVARVPAAVVPTVVFPIFFVVAFSGSFTALTDIPGFGTDNILSWMAPFAILQGASFAGLGTCFGVARDLEDGFYDRLIVAPTPRAALLLGPLLAAMARALLPITLVLVAAFAGGAALPGGLFGIVSLVVAAEGVAVLAALWGLGIVYRLKTQRAGALVQVGIFFTMFLSIGQVPLHIIEGWLHGAARVNPMTNILRFARQGFIGDVAWATTWPGLVAMAIAAVVLAVFAVRGMRTLVP